MDDEILVNEIVERVVSKTIEKLRRADMLKEKKLDSFKKTEKVLYEYAEWKDDEDASELQQKFCRQIEKALKRVSDDKYYTIIELRYFEKWTFEKIAEFFGVEQPCITKNRTRLINLIRPIIFADDFIREIFEM